MEVSAKMRFQIMPAKISALLTSPVMVRVDNYWHLPLFKGKMKENLNLFIMSCV